MNTMRGRQHSCSALVVSVALVGVVSLNAQNYGNFIGTVVAKWLDDGRTMELVEDFGYVDPIGHMWNAPRGSKIDGASIPQVFWSVIGGPFEGNYRNASVLHDVACERKRGDSRLVHRMFYNAMLAGGVPKDKALIMYGAVYYFGPTWIPDGKSYRHKPPKRRVARPDDVKSLQNAVQQEGLTAPEQIEELRLSTAPW